MEPYRAKSGAVGSSLINPLYQPLVVFPQDYVEIQISRHQG